MGQMKRMLISIGSNKSQVENVAKAKELLDGLFANVVYSKDVWTRPVGMFSDNFLNCLASFTTSHGEKQVAAALKQIENRCGRKKPEARNGIIRMDIDILLFGDERRHECDWGRPYIMDLIEDINSKLCAN